MKLIFPGLFTFIVINFSFAQVLVKDEPRHHNVFENNFVRILDVSIKPGDTTLYHIHNTPSVFLYFTRTKVGSNLINQPATSKVNIAGDISYDSLKTARIHRVWNEDTSWFHVMDVEVINPQPAVKHSFSNIKNTELLFDKPLVRGYKLQISSGEAFTMQKSDLRFLLISMGEVTLHVVNNAKEEVRVMKPGHYIWIQENENITIKTLNISPANFALLELK